MVKSVFPTYLKSVIADNDVVVGSAVDGVDEV